MKIGVRKMKGEKIWWVNWNYNWAWADLGKFKFMSKSMFNGLIVGPDKFTDYVSTQSNLFYVLSIY